MQEIFDNYDTFYNMVLSTTIMSNIQSAESNADRYKIIRFIGEAYGFGEDFIDKCADVILNKLSVLERMLDRQAVFGLRAMGTSGDGLDAFLDVKSDVLMALKTIGKNERYCINEGWYDYSHYKAYQANMRYSQIAATAVTGNIIATRQVGILRALGIGCQQDYERAATRLMQCALWGDIPSLFYLGHVHALSGDEAKSKLFYEVAELAVYYLPAGITVLPDSVKEKFSEEARVYYVYISSIAQDIVHAENIANIDFSFIEAITSDSLDYYERIHYINNYKRNDKWKNVTNSSENPTKKIGFR